MPANTKLNGIHAQRLIAIRKFVNFDFDLRRKLTRYQKRKIKTYFDEINALTARPFYVYKPRDNKKLKAAQDFAQHSKKLRDLKVAFISTHEKNPRIRFNKKGEVVMSTRHVTTRHISLDTLELIKNPVEYVNGRIKNVNAKRFSILADKYEIPVSYSKATIANGVARMCERYSNEDANNFHGNWLHGLAAFTFKNQSSYDEYRKSKTKKQNELKRKRKNKKRREQYQRNKSGA